MMGPAAGFLLAIMGCGEGEAQCTQVALAPARFESEAACLAASDTELARHTDADFPVVVAQCRRSDVRIAVNADEVRRPAPGPLPVRMQSASLRR